MSKKLKIKIGYDITQNQAAEAIEEICKTFNIKMKQKIWGALIEFTLTGR